MVDCGGVTKPIPMKRELKASPRIAASTKTSVTKPIPMKRELKGKACKSMVIALWIGHKANPDEKGTERYFM